MRKIRATVSWRGRASSSSKMTAPACAVLGDDISNLCSPPLSTCFPPKPLPRVYGIELKERKIKIESRLVSTSWIACCADSCRVTSDVASDRLSRRRRRRAATGTAHASVFCAAVRTATLNPHLSASQNQRATCTELQLWAKSSNYPLIVGRKRTLDVPACLPASRLAQCPVCAT